jgi:hypothetical protein
VLSYPTTIVDDKTVITGFRKDLLKEALGLWSRLSKLEKEPKLTLKHTVIT